VSEKQDTQKKQYFQIIIQQKYQNKVRMQLQNERVRKTPILPLIPVW